LTAVADRLFGSGVPVTVGVFSNSLIVISESHPILMNIPIWVIEKENI
jgi:hypothetical protein